MMDKKNPGENKASSGIALPEFLAGEQEAELATLLTRIAETSRAVSGEIRRAALADLSGVTGEVNVHGESIKKLDEFTSSVFVEAIMETQLVSQIASEEVEEVVRSDGEGSDRKYSVSLDPLDGSSNTDINGIVGTIFSIHRRREDTLSKPPGKRRSQERALSR